MGAYSAIQRSGDTAFRFHQESHFWYLTGIEAPDWQLVINESTSYLIAPELDHIHEIFNGSLSFEDAKKISGVDIVLSHNEGVKLIHNLAQDRNIVYSLGPDPYAEHYNFSLNPAPIMLHQKLTDLFKEVVDCRKELARMRAIKQPEEIEVMREAVKLTIEAFGAIKPRLAEIQYEYQVEAEFSYYFQSRGTEGHAYDPIVASGKNACTLHYVANNDQLSDGELLLLDIGARVEGYAADITRMYAVGTPTKRQVAVHAAVERAHHKIIALLKPDLRVDEYSKAVDVIMKDVLQSLGLLGEPKDYRTYFPHAISHGLGIDVHDSLGSPEKFLPGMVLTVEPGIYIPEEGIGVRIEDDILITKDGHENLSAALPTSL